MRLKDLQAAACAALVLMSGAQPSLAQQPATSAPVAQQPAGAQVPTPQTQVNPTAPAGQQPVQNDTTGTPGLPQAPQPKPTEPFDLRSTGTDYSEAHRLFKSPLNLYKPIEYPQPRLGNTPRLDNLLRDGKIYLSLSDAVTLALENNYDIAIARINLDIADTDILRAKAGSSLRGVSTGLVTGTLGGSTTTIQGGGGPGGTSGAAGGSGTGTSGLVLSTNGGGPFPENLDPFLTGTLQYERQTVQTSSVFASSQNNTATYDLGFNQGFVTGTALTVAFNNVSATNNANPQFSTFSSTLNSSLKATATQHVLQGCCIWLNRRFIVQAKNDRRITDSAFRQQVIYTITQVENIYWALVSAYEDEQSKTRALQQSTQLTADNRKQLEIGTLAPLDVVNSDSQVATDKQALISSQSNLEYQQLLMKQAIARNLNDPQLANAPVVPTDRVGLDRLPEEDMQVEDLVRQAYTNNPQIEQAVLAMENNKITIRAEKNGLLPVLDAYGFYGSSGLGGTTNAQTTTVGGVTTTTPSRTTGYGTVFSDLFNNNAPDYGVGVSLNIPLRNRTAQADQARSQMEYRQTQMRLQQLYTQVRIQVINAQYALTNDRAQVQAANAANDFAGQSLEAEQKKYRLGASTTANVLQQQRNLATAANNLISATAAYARDRAALGQILSNTLDRYGISLNDAASGTVAQQPNIPGLTAPQAPAPPKPLTEAPAPLPQ